MTHRTDHVPKCQNYRRNERCFRVAAHTIACVRLCERCYALVCAIATDAGVPIVPPVPTQRSA